MIGLMMLGMQHPLITMHSGSGRTEPNSFSYLAYALSMKPDIMEVDVRLSPDGRIVLSHDYKPSYSAGLMLQTVLERCKEHGILVNLDIKELQVVEPVCQVLMQTNTLDQVIFTGCQEPGVEQIHRLLPNANVLFNADRWDAKQPYERFVEQMIDSTVASKAYALNICHEDVMPFLVESCNARGISIFVWTVDESDRMEECISMGVASITTHDVNLLRTVICKVGNQEI